jgi:decaprenylphospho-beta-D-erythro-pentofuranosid-2-ulose 2-reductase
VSSSPKNIVIIGATSAIAESTARYWAAERANLHLVARNRDKLELVSADLRVRGATVTQTILDVDDLARLEPCVDRMFQALGRVDAVLIAHGALPEQATCENSLTETLRSIQTNAISTISLLSLVANKLRSQRAGTIAVIGSVAGDRGRKSNYVYGSAKALVSTFTEGLAGRMHAHGVRVVEIKPGFVDTPMTARFKKGALWARPDTVARIIRDRVAAARSGSFYAPRFWWLIMAIIRLIPARLLYRINI